MFKKASIFLLILGVILGGFGCLCSHEKPAETVTSHSCHDSSSKHKSPFEQEEDCCCIDKHEVAEIQNSYVLSPIPTSFLTFNFTYDSLPLLVIPSKFESRLNLHPPSFQLPIYLSKQSFLI